MTTEPIGQATTGLSYIPDIARRAGRRLLSQDWDKPRLVALAESLGEGAQLLEDETWDILGSLRVADAVGDQLDKLGAMVGEPRGPLGDADYRRFVQARILANICKSSADEIIRIFDLVTSPIVVEYLPMYPAGYTLQAIRPAWLSEPMRRRVRRIMDDIRPAGVKIELIEALRGHFGFDGGDGLGYGEGALARVL